MFLFGPAVRGGRGWSWIGRAIPPTLRSRDPWVRVGAVEAFPVGVPVLTTVHVPVQDGWVHEDAPVAVYVRRTGPIQADVFDLHCTHVGCPVRWNGAAKRFFCPCHGGVYDGAGRALAGPPPRPLDRYETNVEHGTLYMGRLIVPGA
jgi:Rieske Fe-S protein